MIFVTLGTQFFPLDRATEWLKKLLDHQIIREPVIYQHGITSVASLQHPLLTTVSSLSLEEMKNTIQQASLVISHAGQGSTRLLARLGSCFILLPRLKKYGEHVDNHQLDFTLAVANLGIHYCTEFEDLVGFIQTPPPPFEGDFLPGPPLVDYLLTKYRY